MPLSDDEREYITDAHNRQRQKVASGEDKRGGMQNAANMRVFVCQLVFQSQNMSFLFSVLQQGTRVCSSMLGK